MALDIYVVDAFASEPFTGNPAGVCLLESPGEARWMQAVAAEMKHAETAFLSPNGAAWLLRWFTPAAEVDLCGHATLASAHVLWESGRLAPGQPAAFDTRSGRLTCLRREQWIEMDFPAEPAVVDGAPDELIAALGVEGRVIGRKRNRMDYLVELPDEGLLRRMSPDFASLSRAPVRGVIVTTRSESKEYDFVSRFFAPAVGVNEDPVTGSAHCCLGPYWAEKLGKRELIGYQASQRGGVVRVKVQSERVLLGGQALTVLKGQLVGASSGE